MIIYYIKLNTNPARFYIGSTSRDFSVRMLEHIYGLKNNEHTNVELRSDWDLYGPTYFTFGILEEIEKPDELKIAEQEYINCFNPESLYNVKHAVVDTSQEALTRVTYATTEIKKYRKQYILQFWTKKTDAELAADLGIGKSMVAKIRLGIIYRDVEPLYPSEGLKRKK